MPISGCISASIRSAARSRAAARSTGGVDCQIGAAVMEASTALPTSAVVAFCTWPTTSRWSAGFSTGSSAPSLAGQPSIGWARQSAWPELSRALDREARRCSLDMSMPLELTRASPYRALGCGMRGCGRPRTPSTVAMASALATGSSTSSLMEMLWSAMRLTKEVLAPFSSRRRTR
ncbi:hypothetical protein D9M71_318450 [compost metagenome]